MDDGDSGIDYLSENLSEMELTQWRSSARRAIVRSVRENGGVVKRTWDVETFALEYMTKVSAACGTCNFSSRYTP